MGLKMDVKSINQSQMDYVLYGLCAIAYTGRYRGLKDNGLCMWMSECVHVYAHTLHGCQLPMSDDDHWLTILIRRAQ